MAMGNALDQIVSSLSRRSRAPSRNTSARTKTTRTEKMGVNSSPNALRVHLSGHQTGGDHALGDPDAGGDRGQGQADAAQTADVLGPEGVAGGQGAKDEAQVAQDQQETADPGRQGAEPEQQQRLGQGLLQPAVMIGDGQVVVGNGNEDGGDEGDQQDGGDQHQQHIGHVEGDLQKAGDRSGTEGPQRAAKKGEGEGDAGPEARCGSRPFRLSRVGRRIGRVAQAGEKEANAARGPANPVAVLFIAIFMGLVKASQTSLP
jgi:hypothetical protein